MQPKWINQSGTSLALTRIKLAQMDSIEIKAIIKQGENSQVEFKECQDRISHSVYETVCSFLNYKGETPSLYLPLTCDPRQKFNYGWHKLKTMCEVLSQCRVMA